MKINDVSKFITVFALLLAGGCGGGGGGGQPATPTLTISDQVGFEPVSGSRTFTLVATLSSASTQPVTVNYATSNGSATAGADYTQANNTLTFAAGEVRKTIDVTVLADTPYDERDETFTVTLSSPSGATLATSQATATIIDKVFNPDTGITTCANATVNTLTCPQAGFDQQDAEFGNDNASNDNSDGRAGFSFTKLDSNGNDLSASEPTWSCVRDNVTGLVWEIKTNDGGLRDRDITFGWNDTNSYVEMVNVAGLCGANDWRMPTAEELLSLHDYGALTPPGIDTTYFNDLSIANSLTFWASESDASNTALAWVVDYAIGSGGHSSVGDKTSLPSLVRLVRKP